MKLGMFSPVIESMFIDKVDITHYTKKTNGDGTTESVLPETPDFVDVPCRLSFKSAESPADSQVDQTPVQYAPKIFCAVGTDILAGDFIVVRKMSEDGVVLATYKGTAGMPSIYVTHKEVLFSIKESA